TEHAENMPTGGGVSFHTSASHAVLNMEYATCIGRMRRGIDVDNVRRIGPGWISCLSIQREGTAGTAKDHDLTSANLRSIMKGVLRLDAGVEKCDLIIGRHCRSSRT